MRKHLASGLAVFSLLASSSVVFVQSSAGASTASVPGVTKTTITVGQIDDLSAPLPGLFKAAEDGTKAYFAYVNSKGGVDGRKLVLNAQDSKFQSATVAAAAKAQAATDFAFVGGYSLLDSAEAPVLDATHTPDVTYPLSERLSNNSNVYSPSPSTTNDTPTAPYRWAKKTFPKQVKHIGTLYSDASPTNVFSELTLDHAMQTQGLHIVYRRGFSALESTFSSDVLKMKNAGVEMYYMQTIPGSYSATIAQESNLQDFHPVNIVGSAGYIQSMNKLSGGTARGIYLEQQQALYEGEDAKVIPEVALFDKWVTKQDPKVFSSVVPLTALDGWASAMLFTQALKKAGTDPTRARLVAQLNKITSFDAGGLLPPGENPAKNIPSKCFLLARLEGGKWKRVSPTPKNGWICDGGLHRRQGWQPQNR